MSSFWGKSEKVKVKPCGTFYCPACRQTSECQRVERVEVTRVLFVPVKQASEGTGMVKCRRCGSVFEEEVTHHSPDISREGLVPALVSAMLTMMVVDGHTDERELALAARIVSDFTGEAVYPQTLKREAESRYSRSDLDERLATIAPYLTNGEKRTILDSAFRVAHADGVVTPEEEALLSHMASVLDFPETLFRKLLAE